MPMASSSTSATSQLLLLLLLLLQCVVVVVSKELVVDGCHGHVRRRVIGGDVTEMAAVAAIVRATHRGPTRAMTMIIMTTRTIPSVGLAGFLGLVPLAAPLALFIFLFVRGV